MSIDRIVSNPALYNSVSRCGRNRAGETTAEGMTDFWKERFKESGHADEKEVSDREQGRESETEILVKPDGSRVLVMTMQVGGMETVMSMEISKPVQMPGEGAKQMPPVMRKQVKESAFYQLFLDKLGALL